MRVLASSPIGVTRQIARDDGASQLSSTTPAWLSRLPMRWRSSGSWLSSQNGRAMITGAGAASTSGWIWPST
ncbi:hypothetical protein D9M73_243970 [compost metagenome]